MALMDPLDSPSIRKARGAFFTPPAIAQHIAQWAIRSSTDQVLEPSCGEAEFLLATGKRLRELGSNSDVQPQIHGIELHPATAEAARRVVSDEKVPAQIQIANFFDAPLRAEYDAVVGNPPYVRYQAFSGKARAKAQQAALAAGVRLSGLASSWAAFTVRSAELLRRGGRLGLVLPAELLSVNYAGPVRRYLMERFASVHLVMFDERVFPGVLAEAVLLLAEGDGGTSTIEISQVPNLNGLGDPPTVEWRPSTSEGKWTSALLAPSASEVYTDQLTSESFGRLDQWGRTDLGMVSGNNNYFCLSATQASELGLRESELQRISPPGSRHLRGLSFELLAWSEMRDEGHRVYLFAPPRGPLSEAARRHIESGEAQLVDQAYKCRIRKPWWQVPKVPIPDLLLTYMSHDAPRLVSNGAGVAYLNSIHGVRLNRAVRSLGRDLLPLGALNSLTLLGAELVGRSYGGGLLKLEPKEADLLPVPAPFVLENVAEELRSLRPQLAKRMRGGDLLAAVSFVDRVLLVEGIGLSRSDVRELRKARETLFARRRARGSHAEN